MNAPASTIQRPNVSIVVAITSKHAAIGNGGKLLVRISDDLRRFKALTTGHAVIMGRKTYQSIGKALPNRANFVVSRDPALALPDTTVCPSLETAISQAWAHELGDSSIPADKKEIFLIGGGEIYRQGLPFTTKLYLTLVQSDLQGDVFFPDYSEFKKETLREERFDVKTGLKYSWIDLER